MPYGLLTAQGCFHKKCDEDYHSRHYQRRLRHALAIACREAYYRVNMTA